MHRMAIPLICALVTIVDASSVSAQPLLRRLEARLRQSLTPVVPPPVAVAESQPRLGIVVDRVTGAAISEHGLVVRNGALITRIEPGSAADRAGLPLGGVIVAVDGIRIDSPDQLVNLVRGARAGQPLELIYYQGAQLFRKRLEIGPSPQADWSPYTVPPLPGTEPLPETLPAPDSAHSTPPAAERPLLDRLGRVLDGIATAPPEDTPPRPADPGTHDGELARLRKQVETLQSQVERLTKRLAELEKEIRE